MKPTRAQSIKKVLWVVLWLNLAVALGKLVVGLSINSLAMMADGFHSLLDASSNIIGLLGIYLASRPADADHPYGHQKYEAFSALAISVLLALTAMEVFNLGLGRLNQGQTPETSLAGLGVMAATLVVNSLVTRYERRQGLRLQSQVLLADSEHTRSDILVSLSVMAGLGAAWLGWYWVDLAVAFAISGFVLYISYTILKQTASALTDYTEVEPETIRKAALEVREVINTGTIRSRGIRPNLYIDMEIHCDPDLPLWRAHEIAHQVTALVKARLEACDVVVHVEPPAPEYWKKLKPQLAGLSIGRADLPRPD